MIYPTEFWEDNTSPLDNGQNLISGSFTFGGAKMRSNNFQYKLILQDSDGNLVLKQVNIQSGIIWSSHTSGQGTGQQKSKICDPNRLFSLSSHFEINPILHELTHCFTHHTIRSLFKDCNIKQVHGGLRCNTTITSSSRTVLIM